jgi:hypothetical protein
MAIAHSTLAPITSIARNGWVLVGYAVLLAIAIAALIALIYFAGPEVTEVNPSQLIGP